MYPNSYFHFIIGGVRSGKSMYAEKLASEFERVLYIATTKPLEPGMEQRIDDHRKRRPPTWVTEERYRGFASPEFRARMSAVRPQAVLLDCATMLMSNILFDFGDLSLPGTRIDRRLVEKAVLEEVQALIDLCRTEECPLFVVSNEVGLGLASGNKLGNLFCDLSGRVNRTLAEKADSVTFVAVGLPLRLK